MKLRLSRAAVATCSLVALLATPITALAQVPSNIGSFVSYGYGTGVHSIAGSSAFPNFQNGAVNNHYPLAQVEQDASPSSAARATYSDSGPAGATAGSQYNQSCSAGNPPPPPSACPNPNNSVPYANSNYPGGPDTGHVDTCGGKTADCPTARADSNAAELAANAFGYYAGGGTQPFGGATGESHTVVSPDGTLTVNTHSEVDNFVIGTLKVSKVVVDTIATATNSNATANAFVLVGDVTANGQPISVSDQGVTIQQTTVHCPGAPSPPGGPPPGGGPAPSPPPVPSPTLPPLPSAPAQTTAYYSTGCTQGVDVTYIKLFTVAPQKSVSGTHGVASASGLHILVTHPAPSAGVPQQTTEWVLGEGYADASTGAGGGAGNFGIGSFGFGGGNFGFTGPSGDNGLGSNTASNIAHAIFNNRWWPLVLLFLTLEALVLGSAAAWVWARNAPVEEVADEVLSP
jgi:hypothetical protein